MALAYIVLEIPPGSPTMYQKVFHTQMGFLFDSNNFLRKSLSNNAEHFPLNYLLSLYLLISLQGSKFPYGYFLDPSLCLTISPPHLPIPHLNT